MRFLKFFLPLLVIISLLGLWGLNQPVRAAPPDNPKDVPNSIAESNGVTLEKQASAATVPLGQVVTYTITIKNNGKETLSPTLTDALPKPPDGLGLQTATISATVGTITHEDNTVKWSGTLASGEQVTIHYSAIPPHTSQPDRTLNNTASLTFGSTTLEATASITTQKPELTFWGTFVNFIALALVFFDNSLHSVGIPYTFGFAIILFTVIVRLVTFPLNMQQIKASKAMQDLQPRMKELQEKYKNDREKLAQEQMNMYKEAGVNPLGGCLPTLVQMPIWFALYQALVQLSHEGLLNEGFLWIPSLAGPVTYNNGGMDWLWPLPPSIGWIPALSYLVLPVLLIVSQFYMQKMMTPPNPDPQQASMNQVMKIMPLMFGYFSLIVPSGLTLYWFTSNILALVQQYFTQTNLKPATASAGVLSSAPVSVGAKPLNSEEDNKDGSGKAKRKSKRKR